MNLNESTTRRPPSITGVPVPGSRPSVYPRPATPTSRPTISIVHCYPNSSPNIVHYPCGNNNFFNSADNGSFQANSIEQPQLARSLPSTDQLQLLSSNPACIARSALIGGLRSLSQENSLPETIQAPTQRQSLQSDYSSDSAGTIDACEPSDTDLVRSWTESEVALDPNAGSWLLSDCEENMADEGENVTLRYRAGSQSIPGTTYDLIHLGVGDVFTIRDEAAQLTGRTMIIIRNKKGAAQCLSLCLHSEREPKPGEKFVSYHWRVAGHNKPYLNIEPEKVNIHLSHAGARIKEGSWVNFQQQYSVSKVGLRLEGSVGNMEEVMRKYLDVHESMYGHWRPTEPLVEEGMESTQPQAARQSTTRR